MKKYDEAKEFFEAALAARLVIHGPTDESLVEVHNKLRRIAIIQGDMKKASHHMGKISTIQTRVMVNEGRKYQDNIDWTILSEE